MKINEKATEIHKIAKKHGWWNEPKSFGELIALCHSELSEALEEYRNNRKPEEIYYSGKTISPTPTDDCKKPEGIPIELADVIIRILDMCGYYNIDIEKAIAEKIEYNKTRPYKHGGKKI
jgi:NTP pyrophosphatase (non-canonical NTP hydrolase)